jgi:arylsulfatase A-like enzyme
MNIRSLLICAVLLSPLSALNASETNGATPNVIFILSDDHALRTIGAYEGSIIKTPNIDRLAHEGALFNNWFVGNSICCPCRATLLTGKHSSENGVLGNSSKWNSQQWVYPREFGKAGYQTALIGKWHINGKPDDAFQYWNILTGDGGQGSYYNPTFLNSAGESSTPVGYSTEVITDQSLDWLKHRDASKPFLLEVHYKAPHTPRIPAIKDMGKYDAIDFPVPDTLFDDYATRQPFVAKTYMGIKGMRGIGIGVAPTQEELAERPDAMPKPLEQMTPDQRAAWHKYYDPRNREYQVLKAAGKLDGRAGVLYSYQRFIKDYIRTIDGMDENIGRILAYLDQTGLASNTIVIYSSDQGFLTGEHGWAEKRWMYEESFKAPLVIRWPGTIKPGTRIDALTQNIDFAPTLLKAAGIPIPGDIQGVPLQPVLGGTIPANWRKDVLYTYYDGGIPGAPGPYNMPRMTGVRDDYSKLIHYYDYNAWEFYDLKKDPHELNNVYDNPAYASEVTRLKKRLDALISEYHVPAPPKLIPNNKKRPNQAVD